MGSLDAWWAALPVFQKILWVIAVPSSILTILQAILEVTGLGDHSGDVDTDVSVHDAGGMHLFSFKGVVIFFTAFSWVGIVTVNAGLGTAIAAVGGLIAGLVFMALFAWIFYLLHKLDESGNVDLNNAVLKHGETYLRIPGRRSGHGKVMVTVQGSTRELAAVTDDVNEIPTGTPIRVVELLDGDTVLVTREI